MYSRGYQQVLLAKPFLCWGSGGVSTSVRLLVSVGISLGCPLCSSCAFLVVNMSQVSTTMATTTTSPVTVVSSGMSSISSVTVAPSLMGLPTMLGQHDVILTQRCSGGVLGLASMPQQQPPSSMPLQAYANYAIGSPQVGFFFRVEPSTSLYIICLVSVLVSDFSF